MSVCSGKAQFRSVPGPRIYVSLQYILRSTVHDPKDSIANHISIENKEF